MSSADVVVVVGAGPTGLTTALTLAQGDAAVRILDRRPGPDVQPRALVAWSGALEVLRRLGAIESVLAEALPLNRARYFSGRRPGRRRELFAIPLEVEDSVFDRPLVVPQPQVERALHEQLARLGVEVEWEREVLSVTDGPDRVTLTVQDGRGQGLVETIEAAWVVAADGPRSGVRRDLGIELAGDTFPRDFMLVDGVLEGDLPEGEAWYHLTPAGVVVLVPQRNGLHRVFVDCEPQARSDWRPEEVVDLVRTELSSRIGAGVELKNSVWSSRFRVHAKVADRFRGQRVFLAGDAAHVHSPAGGQGMNTGIQDGFDIAWRLTAVRHGGDRRLLDGYEAERRPAALAAVRQAELQTRMWLASGPRAAARDALLRLVGRRQGFQRKVVRRLAQQQMGAVKSPALVGGPKQGIGQLADPSHSAIGHLLRLRGTDAAAVALLRERSAVNPSVHVEQAATSAATPSDLVWVRPDGVIGGAVPWDRRAEVLDLVVGP